MPSSGSTIPAMDFKVMLLPQPEGPRIPKRLFLNSKSISKLNSLSSFWISTFNKLPIIIPHREKRELFPLFFLTYRNKIHDKNNYK